MTKQIILLVFAYTATIVTRSNKIFGEYNILWMHSIFTIFYLYTYRILHEFVANLISLL